MDNEVILFDDDDFIKGEINSYAYMVLKNVKPCAEMSIYKSDLDNMKRYLFEHYPHLRITTGQEYLGTKTKKKRICVYIYKYGSVRTLIDHVLSLEHDDSQLKDILRGMLFGYPISEIDSFVCKFRTIKRSTTIFNIDDDDKTISLFTKGEGIC